MLSAIDRVTGSLAAESDLIATIAATFIGDAGVADEPAQLRARLVVRVVLSLLSHPDPDPADERRLIEQVVAPALLRSPNDAMAS